jgi:hypothetical protein
MLDAHFLTCARCRSADDDACPEGLALAEMEYRPDVYFVTPEPLTSVDQWSILMVREPEQPNRVHKWSKAVTGCEPSLHAGHSLQRRSSEVQELAPTTMTTTTIPMIHCICGRRHQAYWVTMAGVQHGCRYAAAMENDAEVRSASGIARRAAEARQEAEARLVAAQAASVGGPRQARHLAEAARNFQMAYDLEN